MPKHKSNFTNPFKALKSYEKDERKEFHGRRDETYGLYHSVKQQFFTVFYGDSGSGKSSLINAGLSPKLEANGFLPIRFRMIHVLTSSLGITEHVENTIRQMDVETEFTQEEERGYLNKTLWGFFHYNKFFKDGKQIIPVLMFDQFEEIFQSKEYAKNEQFIRELSDLIENHPPRKYLSDLNDHDYDLTRDYPNCRVMISLKSSYIPHLGKLSNRLPSLNSQNKWVFLDLLTYHQALSIIQNLGGNENFDDGAAEEIVNRLAENDVTRHSRKASPIMLSLFCHELFENVVQKKGRAINKDDIKGEEVIFENFYNSAMAPVSTKTKRYIEKNLVTQDSRSIWPEAKFRSDNISEKDLNVLIDEKKILNRNSTSDGTAFIEVSHDKIGDVIIKASNKRKEKWQNIKPLLLGAGAIIAVLVVVGIVNYINENKKAQLYQKISEESSWFREIDASDRDVALTTLMSLENNEEKYRTKERSFALASRALEKAKNNDMSIGLKYLYEAQKMDKNTITEGAIQDFPETIVYSETTNVDGELYSLAVSKENTLIMATDSEISFRNIDTYAVFETIGYSGLSQAYPGASLKGLQNGYSVYYPGRLGAYKIDERGNITNIIPNPISAVANFDGTRFYMGTYGGKFYAQPSNSNVSQIQDKIPSNGGQVYDMSISPNKRYLAYSNEKGSIHIYDFETEQEVASLLGFPSGIISLTFTTDNFIFFGSNNSFAYLWDWKNEESPGKSVQHDEYIHFVTYDPVNERYLTCSADNTARLYDKDLELLQIMNHGGDVYTAQFINDGAKILTGSKDKKLYTWTIIDREDVDFDFLASLPPLPENEYFEYVIDFDEVKLIDADTQRKYLEFLDHKINHTTIKSESDALKNMKNELTNILSAD